MVRTLEDIARDKVRKLESSRSLLVRFDSRAYIESIFGRGYVDHEWLSGEGKFRNFFERRLHDFLCVACKDVSAVGEFSEIERLELIWLDRAAYMTDWRTDAFMEMYLNEKYSKRGVESPFKGLKNFKDLFRVPSEEFYNIVLFGVDNDPANKRLRESEYYNPQILGVMCLKDRFDFVGEYPAGLLNEYGNLSDKELPADLRANIRKDDVPATQRIKELLEKHTKEHPKRIVPIYDLRGNLIWPSRVHNSDSKRK